MYICITGSLYCISETNTTLQINYDSIKKIYIYKKTSLLPPHPPHNGDTRTGKLQQANDYVLSSSRALKGAESKGGKSGEVRLSGDGLEALAVIW